jgi:hypothetical protein
MISLPEAAKSMASLQAGLTLEAALDAAKAAK